MDHETLALTSWPCPTSQCSKGTKGRWGKSSASDDGMAKGEGQQFPATTLLYSPGIPPKGQPLKPVAGPAMTLLYQGFQRQDFQTFKVGIRKTASQC